MDSYSVPHQISPYIIAPESRHLNQTHQANLCAAIMHMGFRVEAPKTIRRLEREYSILDNTE